MHVKDSYSHAVFKSLTHHVETNLCPILYYTATLAASLGWCLASLLFIEHYLATYTARPTGGAAT